MPPDDYKTLLKGDANEAWDKHSHFDVYVDKFNASAEVTSLYKTKWFKVLPESEQEAEINRRYLAFVQNIERDKLYHFVMASDQPNPVLLIRSPTDTKAIRKFLGYGWSDAKGNEGIQLNKDGNGRIVTALYDETDRHNAGKINRLIADNFDGVLTAIPAAFREYAAIARLVDLLDFSRTEFEKQVLLSIRKDAGSASVSSQWPMAKLGDITEIHNGGTPDTGAPDYWEGGNICWATLADTKNKYLVDTQRKITQDGLKFTTLLPVNTVIFSSRATIGEVCINTVPTSTNQGYKSFVCNSEKLRFLYLYHLLVSLRTAFENLVPSGSKYKEINTKTISSYSIPLPPLTVQDQIITECEIVDTETDKAQAAFDGAMQAIDAKVEAIYASSAPRQTIDSLALSVQYGLNEKMNEEGIGYRIFRMNEIVRGHMVDNGAMKYANISAEEFTKYKLNRGDLLFNRTNSIEHVGKTGLFDLNGDYCFASYLVRIAPDTNKVLPLFLARMMNSSEFQKEAKTGAAKAINQANINATKMRNLKIPVPTPAIQRKFVAEIEALERKITEAKTVIEGASSRKNAILARYLW